MLQKCVLRAVAVTRNLASSKEQNDKGRVDPDSGDKEDARGDEKTVETVVREGQMDIDPPPGTADLPLENNE